MSYRSASEKRMERYLVAFFGFVMLGVLNLLNALLVMLGLGVAHQQWPAVPAFGFWATYLLLCAVSCVAGAVGAGMRVKTDDK